MQVKKFHSYAYFGTKQFAVDIPLILSTDLINSIKANPTYYERTYADLHESSPAAIVNNLFDCPIWDAFQTGPNYIGILSDDPAIVYLDDVNNISNLLGMNTTYLHLDVSYPSPGSTVDFLRATNLKSVTGDSYTMWSDYVYTNTIGRLQIPSGEQTPYFFSTCNLMENNSRIYFAYDYGYVRIFVLPDDFIVNGQVNPDYSEKVPMALIDFFIGWNEQETEITFIQISDAAWFESTKYNLFFAGLTIPDYAQDDDDMDNPYGEPGTSGPGGGDGSYGDPDEVDPTSVPDLPTISASSTGFITIYNPTTANLSSLGNFLWSNLFDINTFKKLYTDPMDCIISLGIVPCVPTSGGTQNIKFGNVDTGINCSYLSTQYVKVDCGSVNITKYVGSFMDYSPYVKISLFLPYIGFINLGTDDIMGGSINVTYHVDILSGDCIAFITHSSKGVLYSYTGNCLTNVPVTSANYANSLRNYYEAVSGIIPSTCNGAASGGAAGAASGAINGALSAASNIILNTKPDYQRSGSLGGSAGIMGVQKPFIVIERPNISVPNKVQHYMGQTSNITASLGGLSGMTIVEAVHLEGIPCTTSELAEIESILKSGVIL